MKDIKKTILTLVALLAVTTGAWAQTETLLTTITPTGQTTYSETTPGAVTVTQDCNKYNERGWCFEGKLGSVTVEANEGYTISKCVFIVHNGANSITRTISTSPFKINFVYDSDNETYYCEGTNKNYLYDGVKSIQVYTNTVDVTGINLDKTEASMTVGGDALTLTATVAPANATNKTVTWTSSDDNVATVADGVVTAVAPGTATITATATNGTDDTSDDKTATCEVSVADAASSGPEVAWDKAKKSGTFTMPGGNVTLEPEYYPQAALAAAPTAINDVPATTDGAIVSAGTVASIGETTTAQGTVMYYVSPTALDDAALLALTADQWTADVPTAAGLAQGQAHVYYYVRGNDSDNDDENFSDGDILAANALTVTIAAEPTYAVTFADGVNPEPPAEPEWTASPAADVKKGQTVTVTYTGTKKVIGVKAEKKAKADPTVTLTPGEIGDLFSWGSTSKTINGITIAISGDSYFNTAGLMQVSASDPDTGEPVPTTGTYTFTSSVGNIKRIDINHNSGRWWGSGAGWPGSYEAYDTSTFTWSGTPAASVTLSGSFSDEHDCSLYDVSSFVFTIEPTN